MLPWGVQKLWQKTETGPEACKKDPRKLPRPEVQPERSKEDPEKDPRDPRGAPEATQDRKVSNSLSKIDGFK